MAKRNNKYCVIQISKDEAHELSAGASIDITIHPATGVGSLAEAEVKVKELGPGMQSLVVSVVGLYNNEPVNKSIMRRHSL